MYTCSTPYTQHSTYRLLYRESHSKRIMYDKSGRVFVMVEWIGIITTHRVRLAYFFGSFCAVRFSGRKNNCCVLADWLVFVFVFVKFWLCRLFWDFEQANFHFNGSYLNFQPFTSKQVYWKIMVFCFCFWKMCKFWNADTESAEQQPLMCSDRPKTKYCMINV